MQFKKAKKTQTKLRLALCGASGSGKTYSALSIASNLVDKIAVIDTENGSASKYADIFSFDVLELRDHHPDKYVAAIKAAIVAGYELIIIDSMSHAWAGKNGALELNTAFTNASKSGNSFTAWGKTTPIWQSLIDTIVGSTVHVIVTMRSKTEYIITENERGKQTPKKVGMAPVIRDGSEYEFDIVGELNQDNYMSISKTRCQALTNKMFEKPGADFANILKDWLSEGEEVIEQDIYEKIKELIADINMTQEELNQHLFAASIATIDELDTERANKFAAWLERKKERLNE